MAAPAQPETSDFDRKKAKAFFDRGNAVAATGNYDYAIEMYLSGLALDPDNVDCHSTLRDIALKRKVTGGKAAGMMERMKVGRPTKDDKQNMLNQEKLLSMDPGSTDHMVGLMQNALRAGFPATVKWMGPILQNANKDAAKPEVNKFIVLRDAYKVLEEWKLAADACQYALMLRPDDMDLQNEFRHLGALDATIKGKYHDKGGFRNSMKDQAGQEKLMRQDGDVRTMDQMGGLIRDAEAEYKADPTEAGKINKYAEILAKTEQPDYENKAIEILQKAFDSSKQFRFRQKIGTIRMAQMNRMERQLRATVQSNPQDQEALQTYRQFAKEKLNDELAEFQLVVEAYPTDGKSRFELAVRFFKLRRYDEAIPVLQQLRSDPKYRIDAAGLLGNAFLEAGYVDEAVDTLATLLGDYPTKGDKRSIELTYIYGRALEMKKELQSAIKQYSQVAQWDFNFKDVQERIKKLRADIAGGASPGTV